MKLKNAENIINTISKANSIRDLKIPNEDLKVFQELNELRKDSFESSRSIVRDSFNQYLEEKRSIFLEFIPKSNQKFAEKFVELPGYDEFLAPIFATQKPEQLEYLYSVASKKDSFGELRIPATNFLKFSSLPVENLKQIEPMLLYKNLLGTWAYPPEFFLDLDKYSAKQIEMLNKLVSSKVEAEEAIYIVKNPDLNWEKIVEKAENLNNIYSEKLREVRLFTNRLGENYLCAELQLPPASGKTRWSSYEEVFSRIDDDVNPVERLNLKSDIDDVVENIYSKIEKNLCKFSEKDLERIVTNLLTTVPNTNKKEVLTVIQKLTQFANYTSLKPLAKVLKANNVGMIGSYGELGPVFQYFHKYKNLLDLSEDKVPNGAFFVTKNDMQKPDFIKLLKRVKNSSDVERIKFINLEGWSNGVNLLGDDTKLEKSAKKLLLNAHKLMDKKQNLTFNDAVDKVLNWGLEKKFNEFGLELTTVKFDKPISEDVILDQMKPIVPSKTLLTSTIESIAKHFTTTKRDYNDLSKAIASYYDETVNIYTKQTIIESLKTLNEKINQYLLENNLSKDDLYFIQPVVEGRRKSFEVINKMYQDLFDIPEDRILKIEDLSELYDYSSDSTFVILDDIVGSGESMVEVGQYNLSADVYLNGKHILFAPITASQKGLDYIREVITDMDRADRDAIIVLNENVRNNDSFRLKSLNKFFEEEEYAIKAYGAGGYRSDSQCTVFPYMSPDNNSELSSHLTSFFLPSIGGAKNRGVNAAEIKETIYYYDVFGTDKNHIMKDYMRVYAPKVPKPNPVVEFFKKLFFSK